MLKNADMPAMPRAEAKSHIDTVAKDALGLTKREEFAKAAMQGMVTGLLADGGDWPNRENVAANAVAQADALLTELEKTQ